MEELTRLIKNKAHVLNAIPSYSFKDTTVVSPLSPYCPLFPNH